MPRLFAERINSARSTPAKGREVSEERREDEKAKGNFRTAFQTDVDPYATGCGSRRRAEASSCTRARGSSGGREARRCFVGKKGDPDRPSLLLLPPCDCSARLFCTATTLSPAPACGHGSILGRSLHGSASVKFRPPSSHPATTPTGRRLQLCQTREHSRVPTTPSCTLSGRRQRCRGAATTVRSIRRSSRAGSRNGRERWQGCLRGSTWLRTPCESHPFLAERLRSELTSSSSSYSAPSPQIAALAITHALLRFSATVCSVVRSTAPAAIRRGPSSRLPQHRLR